MATQAVPTSKYKPREFNKKKYSVDNYQYPSDLMGLTPAESSDTSTPQPLYGGNYVIFYINVNNESKMVKNPETPDSIVDIDPSERIKKNLAGRQYSQKAVIAAQAFTGAGVAGIITGSSGSSIGSGLKGAVAGAAVGGLSALAVISNTENSTFSRPQKRLKSVIALHVPNQLSIRYGAGWSEEETFALQALIQGGEAAGRALVEAGKALANKKDRKSTRLNSSHTDISRMPSSA